MRAPWQIGVRLLCTLLTLVVALALIPSVTDTVVAQGTGTPEVCQRIASIMPRLLQTADRLREEQDQYQKDLDAEYQMLQDFGAAVAVAGFKNANQNTRV